MKGSICDRHLRRHIKKDNFLLINKNFVTSAAKSITITTKNIIDRVRTVRQVPADGMLPSDEKPSEACVAAPASAAT